MTLKAIYEDGVFKPREPVDLADRTEVEIEIRAAGLADENDPKSFVGFIKTAPAGVPVARNHDEHLIED